MAGIIAPSGGNQPFIDCNGQLNDDQLLGIFVNFSASLDVLEKDLHSAIRAHNFRSLSTEEQVKVDTFLVYVNSTLFWMYLKLQGCDLSKIQSGIFTPSFYYSSKTGAKWLRLGSAENSIFFLSSVLIAESTIFYTICVEQEKC
ncbi:uncharacterized protein Dvir_GJ18423, isoform B [Drosophila virilis]|uniref:Uncharacterized protein, isoform B n=1 Tax=Drosophila virilis TaxID=7244 RepID=A0A0Q9WKD4_DROVI|nr:uncharacterized protein LOC6635300 isoform X2 [Drosophila virilis]KRF85277.1 uncharacterized protein Dvir_GJ18423, isoform B [Drosophila virilis]